MSEDTFEINFAAVAQFEFYSSNDSDRIESAFEDLYGESGETFGGPIMMSGGHWKRTIFSKNEDLPEQLSQFENIRTYLTPDKRHVYDAVTVGKLEQSTLQKILTADLDRVSSVVRGPVKALNEFTNDIPTIPEDQDDLPTILYVEPEEKLDIGRQEEGLDTDVTSSWLEAHREQLQRIKILLGQPISLVGGEDLLAPHSMGPGYIRQATILNTSATHEDTEKDVMGPLWLRRVENAIKPYYRADCWLNHRRRKIGEIDDQTHGTARIFDKDRDGNELDFYQSVEQDLESLREQWINQYTLIRDELADLDEGLPLESEEEPDPAHEIPLQPPARTHEPVSLYQNYEDHLASLFEVARADMDRIGDKLERVSQFIHDSVSAKTAASNIELQSEVKDLTRILTWLTLFLAAVGFLQLDVAIPL
ncbi:hypothetical protein C461_04342 [Halorubrum aidingense JCM 13560]|uniref:Uncharacterized protein n=1 Tax=Halorubrum aidingense JCM 13560 TaxID=1230454 RepID=M0PGW3_9EURY|nr:hypothetical protein [Halorubrum aidingense]EMA68829.1 hypothetical protein C461_04342 [Halorubrum aidingense JCM 13560]